MKRVYLKLILISCFVFSGTTKGIAQDDFQERQRNTKLEHYKKWLSSKAREVFFTNRFKASNLENLNYNSIDYSSLTKEETNQLSGKSLNNSSDINYKRSSLYTLMISNTSDEYLHYLTRFIFADSRVPEKFNDHNIGPYLIRGKAGSQNQEQNIADYLNKNKIAKQMVARWFNRGSDGSFNMNLVARRGEYNASELDIQVALNSARGKAILKDAGEELIGNTFVVVYDFENIDNKENVGLFKYGLQSNITTRAYLYRLVWDDRTAAVFYNDYWMDNNHIDPSRKEAFENSDIFKLNYIGSVVIDEKSKKSLLKHSKEQLKMLEKETLDWSEVTLDQDEASVKNALSVCLNELERKYEEFRTKFPLYSGDPIAAKVGKKEGIKEGDTFEVVERVLSKDGTTEYRKMGTIKVGKEKDIWDNTTQGDWFGDSSTQEFTIFQGQKGKYKPGMLIRKIN